MEDWDPTLELEVLPVVRSYLQDRAQGTLISCPCGGPSCMHRTPDAAVKPMATSARRPSSCPAARRGVVLAAGGRGDGRQCARPSGGSDPPACRPARGRSPSARPTSASMRFKGVRLRVTGSSPSGPRALLRARRCAPRCRVRRQLGGRGRAGRAQQRPCPTVEHRRTVPLLADELLRGGPIEALRLAALHEPLVVERPLQEKAEGEESLGRACRLGPWHRPWSARR